MLKHIPLLIIRALPSLYYWGKYGAKAKTEKVEMLYTQNLEYLIAASELINAKVGKHNLKDLISLLYDLNGASPEGIVALMQQFTLGLSQFCEQNQSECHEFYQKHKEELINLYRNIVNPLQVMVITDQQEGKLPGLLCNFCYYKIDLVTKDLSPFKDSIAKDDFVILTELDLPEVHRIVDGINAYHKPGMIVATGDKISDQAKSVSRHAMQLIRAGYPVLLKIITPLRLFTTIEKTFIKYHTVPVRV